MSYNQLYLQLERQNSSKVVEFQHPVTGAWADGAPDGSNPNRFSVTFTGLAAGQYSNLVGRLKGTSITATYPGPVTVASPPATTANQPPSVSFSPTTNTQPTVGVQKDYLALATDQDGMVNLVELVQVTSASNLAVLAVLASDATSPYSLSWTPSTAGTYYLAARATDNLNASALSSVLMVVVQAAAVNTNDPTAGPALPAGTPTGVTDVFFDGDSLTAGYIANGSFTGATDSSTGNAVETTAKHVKDVPGTTYFRSFLNSGVPGMATAAIVGTAHDTVFTSVDRSQSVRSIVCLQLGANDPTMSVADWFGYVKQYVADATYYGVGVILITNSPSPNTASTDKATYLRANFSQTGAYALYDLAADSRIQNTANGTYYQSDGLHYQVAMNQLIANGLAPLIKQYALSYSRSAGSTLATEAAQWQDVSGTSVSGTTLTGNADNATARSYRSAVETSQATYLSAKFTVANGGRGFVGVANSDTNELLYSFYQNGGSTTPYRGSGYESSGDSFRAAGVGTVLELKLTTAGVVWTIGSETITTPNKSLQGGRYHLVFQALNAGFAIRDASLTAGLYEGTNPTGTGTGTSSGTGTGTSSVEGVSWVNDANTTSTGPDLYANNTSGSWTAGAHSSRLFNQPASGKLIGTINWTYHTANPHFIGYQTGAHGASYPPNGAYRDNNGLYQAWVGGGASGSTYQPVIGDKLRLELYTDQTIFLANGTAWATLAATNNAASYYVQASFNAGGNPSRDLINHVWLSGPNLTGTAGGAIPTDTTLTSSTENVTWTGGGNVSGNSVASTTGNEYLTATRYFQEYKLPAAGVRASLEITLSNDGGRYVVGFAGYSLYKNGGQVSPYDGSNVRNGSDGMVAITDGEKYRIEVTESAVIWYKGGQQVYVNNSVVLNDMTLFIQFYGGGSVNNAVITGYGIASV